MWCCGAWLVVAALALASGTGAEPGAGPGPGPGPPSPTPPLALRFPHALYNVSLPENCAPRTRALTPPLQPAPAVLLPTPDARCRFRIRHGDKDKFFKAEERVVGNLCFLTIRTRAGHADVLNRERRDSYRLEIHATIALPDGSSVETDTVVLVNVDDENDLSPLFYPTEYDVVVSEDTPPHTSIARVIAEDADLGVNGEIYYVLEDPAEPFAVHPTSGVVTVTRQLLATERANYDLTALAQDRASLQAGASVATAARASLTVRVARANLHAPEMRVRHLPELREDSTPELYAIVEVHDKDSGEHGRIANLEIVDGDPDGHFRVRRSSQPDEFDVEVHALLDREATPRGYNLTLRATDAGRPPRSSYLMLPVVLADINDNAPVFSREVYEASITETAPPNTPVIRLKVTDRDEGDNARVYIEIVGGNEGGEFIVNPDTGVLYTAVSLDAEDKSLYTLTVSAIDQGEAGSRKQSSAKVKITVIDMNDNDPVFEDDTLEVTIAENGPSGDVVARVTARDADSGENAYISYSIANLQPVPFDVDHFSGIVRTTRLLDYESMRREYILRIRASDWGLPYRRQAEMQLKVRLKDINDNRPQFERVDCVGYLPRRLPIGFEIITLSAIDFDTGDVVSYRIIGGNDDNCFSLDTNSGVLSLACEFEARGETRVLNVTATDGTHFADATSLTLHAAAAAAPAAPECRDTGVARRLTDLLAAGERSNTPQDNMDEFTLEPSRYGENLHAPEFIDFPVEVKVNESVALGTSLVRLYARDRDLGYNGLLAYGISGGDPDSAFRIDPDSGELEVIGYLDRERESEYYLNVTVYDLGRPRRSSSRLLPITVIDVNDNQPRFEKTLASFRVTENALNGTTIFRANATDSDSGDFGRVTYSLSGAEAGEFCVEPHSGIVRVCASLDRERRALYELAIHATDGGGLTAEARVRVAVDDVNDNAPRFSLSAYSARVREDVPVGTLVAVIDAADPDLAEGGDVHYSLQDQSGDDEAFIVDRLSGTLRTAKRLDFEEKQVYGLTVRATDGGRPELWSEASVVVEVLDVDENRHAPAFPEPVVRATVREDAPAGVRVARLHALDADPPGRDSRLAYSVVTGSGLAHFSVDDTGTIHTLTPLDRETTPSYWLSVCAQDHGLVPRYACVEVYVEVEDVNDMVPWPDSAAYSTAVEEHCGAGTRVVRVRAHDADAAPAPAALLYSIVAGNPDGLFSIDEHTGEIVTTGRTLDREAAAVHALEVRCWDGALAGSARVTVVLRDINDHSPAFTQRGYDVRLPAIHSDAALEHPSGEVSAQESGENSESSVEGDADEDEEGSGSVAGAAAWAALDERDSAGVYVTTVLALDPDAGANGTVRYSLRARGAARGLLRVNARSGRVTAARALRLHEALEATVRACDGGRPARCGQARVSARGARRVVGGESGGPGAAPRVSPVPALQVAELDAPGFLLAVVQATDPDADPLYFDIVDGDPEQEFYIGREDGSLVLARRLLWERRPNYVLNVSVTDGTYTVHAPVNITVINDANEDGVSFSREEYLVETSESIRVGEVLVALHASVAGPAPAGDAAAHEAAGRRLLFGVHAARAPASLQLFRLHELTGVLELAQPLDRESATIHELTVWVRDGAPRASRAFARVTVVVHDADEHAPTWGRRLAEARVSRNAAPGTLVAALRAADRDAGEAARVLYSLAGGDAGGLFAVDVLGDVRLARTLPAAPRGPRDYTLHVRAANPPPGARSSTLPLHVVVVDPEDAPPRFAVNDLECEVYENEPAGRVVATVAPLPSAGAWLSLEGAGAAAFRLNPFSGALATARPLDYEACAQYNLTVRAINMGGGTAVAQVVVHVGDRNEFPPRLAARTYRGRVSEAARAGALVSLARGPAGAPLVLDARDADGPAQRARAYRLHPPAAAAAFHVDATTGALRLVRPLDYETEPLLKFTVKVLDASSPSLPTDSAAEVVVEVVDVNDCPPTFERALYEATLLLPTAEGVEVLRVRASDPDAPSGLAYSVLEGDAAGAFSLSAAGALRVARADVPGGEHRLRVRASDSRYSATARVLVRVRPANNSGLAFQKTDYYGSVVENSTKPMTIAVLNVLGAALNENVEFKILNPTEGFEMGRSTGAVRSTGLALDREQRDAYSLLVQARSGGVGGAEPRVAHARLHVAVTDVNDNCPVFAERPYVAAVRAGAEPGEAVLRVRAIDADANDNGEVRYEMKRGHGELFRVDRKTGQITLKQTLDTPNQLYTLVIAAFDGGVPACGAEAEVAVRVWGGGAAPAWERAHFELQAREDAVPGAPLGTLRARSPLARALIYTLEEPRDSSLFELHFDTAPDRGSNPCVLAAAAALDYEAAREHRLVVRATDGVTGTYADAELTLRLLDVNDCAPHWERDEYRAAVSEAADVGDLVLRVAATDKDSGLNGEIEYSIRGLNGETSTEFTIDDGGAVRLAAPLDAELVTEHHLVLVATDRGAPPLHTTAHLFVAVQDVNDCAPRMERSVVPALVSQEAARGTVVGRAAAWDPDVRDAPRLRYALLGGGGALHVDERSGVLSVGDARLWATAAPRSLNVSVSDGAHAAFARLKLTLAPANRHAPRFPHLVYEARALENQPPPLLLTTVKAYDEDAGEYGTVTYSIPSARLRETFAIDAASGALTTRVPLDREARAEWSVPVTARDGGGLLQHTAVRVRVADLNDNAPAFPLREYHAIAPPDRAPAAPLLTLRAADADEGDNARLAYSLLEPQVEAPEPPGALHARGLFAIDAQTGVLSFARNATEFSGRCVEVWVRARDGGGLVGEAPARVCVTAAGPRVAPPPADVFVPEDAPPGTLVLQLRADPAALSPRFRLAAARSADLFQLDAAGRLTLAAPLDREAAAEHFIGMVAEDAAGAVLLQTTLHVLDVNEHAPSFHSQPYVVHVAENTPPHSSLVQLMADDPDAGTNGEIRFSLSDSESAEDTGSGGLFSVDPYTGWVVTVAPLDREARAEHRLTLLASDGGAARRAARGSLVVRLQDYNDCPPRFAAANAAATVREDASPGTVVVRLALEDADLAAAPLAFLVAAGDPRARFQLRDTGELIVARRLDRESEPSYELQVIATDGKFSANTVVMITVLDVNDNPPYCATQRLHARLREDGPRGAHVAALLVHDADEPPAPLRYFLTGDYAHHYYIHEETGVVTVAEALDRESIAEYRLEAHAQDSERAEWRCSSELLVSLDDVNDNAPRFSADTYSVTLPEDAEIGTLVAKVHATDPDLGENRLIRYSLAEVSDTFAVEPASGIVTLRAPLDREAQAEHRLVLLARDAGSPPRSATAALRLTVADVNDNPPDFERDLYRAAVPELDAVGTEVIRVKALSQDQGVNAEVSYSIVSGDDREDFTIDQKTGAISIARPLDYERRREYFLTVQALDGGSPPLGDLTSVNITVIDGNDNAPSFSQTSYGARVREDAAVGTRVLQVIANDADDGANGRITYTIVRGDPSRLFTVDKDTGYVSLVAPLDRETAPAFVLEIRARDRGEPALEAATRLNIEVLDANDNPPLFAKTNYTAVVQEDRPLGYTILKFDVDDADSSPNAAPYTFDFQSGNEMGAFRLEQDGFLRSATRFNHRIKDRYVLQVRVFDNGTPPLYSDAWVYIKVIEESQYPPVVTPLEVIVNSYLDEFPGGVIGKVHASDRDAYDTLAFSVAPVDGARYPATDLFEIDPMDGTLRAAPRLDIGDYRLNVTVNDGKFVSFAVVRVTVVLITDEMLTRAIVVRFREVTARDFILSHRKGFVRAVREATDCEMSDVVIISVQASGEEMALRRRRQIAQDLDVAFAVRAPGGGFLAGEVLRRLLHAHLERLEERARLVVEELPRGACGGCVRGACAERVELRGAGRALAADVFALVAPPHRLRAECACEPGYGGPRCDRAAGSCATADCGAARCEPAIEPPGYRCCDSDDCRAPPPVVHFAGDGYLLYRLERGVVDGERLLDDRLTISFRFRTRCPRGIIAYVAGRVDYLVLEVEEGFLQVRMELGSGTGAARAGPMVADGAWHEARLERRGAAARLTVDRRSALAQAPPPAAVLDARADRLLVGAALIRHAHALAPEQVTYGFNGCISDFRVSGSALPLEEGGLSDVGGAGGDSGHATLLQRVRVRAAPSCPPLPPSSPCAAYPCLNGGTCEESPRGGFVCACHARFGGARCELDSDPCASAPCLHGGRCSAAAGGAGWECACAAGLEGARCERGRWCAAEACAHGGLCEEGEWGPTCRCRGYYGPRCEYDVDECAGEPCLNGATCLNEPGSFRCLCPPDKTGMNCGNPLYSDAVVSGSGTGGGAESLQEVWAWCVGARWPLAAAGAVFALLALCVALPLLLRRARSRRSRQCAARPAKLEKLPTKLSNLEAVRRAADRPTSCLADPPPLNNIDTLRSYGSAGDELEGIPPDYIRNLNIEPPDRKPWSEQMHLHTFVDNKIYNDLKACKPRVRPFAGEPHLVGGYHWDCSDWCGGGGALPGISEVAGSERPDSSSPASPAAPPGDTTDSAADDLFHDGSAYLLHPDEYLPREEECAGCEDESPERDAAPHSPLLRRAPHDSLISMLEERHSLLGGAGSCSDLSANLCEIEESDAEEPPAPLASGATPAPTRHTAV